MSVDEKILNQLALNFNDSLSHDIKIRNLAESSIARFKSFPKFSVLLLTLISKADIKDTVRLSAAIAFKNFVKHSWDENSDYQIPSEDKNLIKSKIIDLIAVVPENVQKQLCEAIGYIGKQDFPSKWLTLLSQITDKFQTGDFKIINGVLQIMQSIFERYCHEFKSEELWQEIKYVLTNFAQPLTELFKATLDLLQKYSNDPKALQIIVHSLTLMAEIFYSLNYQDLPEYFEDNMSFWMEKFRGLLTFHSNTIQDEDDDVPSKLDYLKAKICNIITLYSEKYDEDFKSYTKPFFQEIWNIVIKLDAKPKNDPLAIAGIETLSTIIGKRENIDDLLANDNQSTEQIRDQKFCENVFNQIVVPNILIRDTDVENFQDNPFEYIRFDLESSDSGTRRRACANLVKILKNKYKSDIQRQDEFVKNFIDFSQNLILNYQTNPITNWRYKDLAILLYSCIFVPPALGQNVSTFLTQYGQLLQFFQSQIIPEFAEGPGSKELAIVKADCLKFLIVYRILVAALDQSLYTNFCRHVILQFLSHEYVVIHSYSALLIERSLIRLPAPTVANIGHNTLLNPETIKDIVPNFVENIFKALSVPQSKENEYLMKALMRVLLTFKSSFGAVNSPDAISALASPIISNLLEILARISKNPTKPYFNHYLFECVCICVDFPLFSTNFQPQFLALVDEIFKNEVQEFIPYVFQIISGMVESPQYNAPDVALFQIIFPYATQPKLWEKTGNIPALVRLLIALLYKFNVQIRETPKNMENLLGIVQKLVTSKSNDHEGFRLLKAILYYMDKSTLESYQKPIFFLLFQRLQTAKTAKYLKDFVLYISFYVNQFGSVKFNEVLNTIQPNMLIMVIEKIYIPNLILIAKRNDKRVCCLAMIKLLTQSQPFFDVISHPDLWSSLFENLVTLMDNQGTISEQSIKEMDGIEAANTEEAFANVLDPPLDDEYSASFSKLLTLKETPGLNDVTTDNPQQSLILNLKQMFCTLPADKMAFVQKSLKDKTMNLIAKYIN